MRLTSKVVVLRSLVCLVIQPALFFGMIKLAELTGTIAQATFVGSTMPPATLSFMFAQQHATYETESVARVGHIDRRIDRQVEPNGPPVISTSGTQCTANRGLPQVTRLDKTDAEGVGLHINA